MDKGAAGFLLFFVLAAALYLTDFALRAGSANSGSVGSALSSIKTFKECTDTDGPNYYVPGTAKYRGASFPDACISGGNVVSECSGPDCALKEYSCDLATDTLKEELYSCEYGPIAAMRAEFPHEHKAIL